MSTSANTRREFLKTAGLGAAALALPELSAAAEAARKAAPPNIVIIYTDDQGYADLGCFGAEGFETPNLDGMAAEGVRFTNFHVAQAVCSASRTALLTGCYPNRVGILGALGPNAAHGISDGEMTIAQNLKQRGYATAAFGKWHLGHLPQFLPPRHGFDEYFGLPYSNDMWPRHPESPSAYPDLPLIEGEKVIERNPDQTQLTTWYTEHAVKFIEKSKDRPFFLYVAHNMPHVPLHVSGKFKGKSKRGLYGDVIMELDWSAGQILATLMRCGLADRTLVIFASDNGPWLSYGDHGGSARPLREGKGTIWEGGIRVPCIMRWPGRIPAGSVCREPAMTIDILPTLAGLAGAELPKHKIDGLDIWPLISGAPGAKSPHDAYYLYWGAGLEGVLSGKWKLHFPHPYRSMEGQPAGKGGTPGKYVNAQTELALYDLENDVGEQRNVAAEHPDVVKRLTELARAFDDDLKQTRRAPGGKVAAPKAASAKPAAKKRKAPASKKE